MPPDPSQIVESAGARYGLLGTISAILLLGLIWFIRMYLQANATIGREREAMVREREQTIAREALLRAEHAGSLVRLANDLKLEHEEDCRELSQAFAKELSEHVRVSRETQEQLRREFSEAQERLASEIAAMATRNNQTIDKLTDRLLVQAPRRGGY